MRLPIQSSRLIQDRSDEWDKHSLANEVRDDFVNTMAHYWQSVSTTDATLTVVWTDSMPGNSVADIEVSVVASTPGAAQGASYKRRATFRRPGAGAAILIGVVDTIGADHEDVAGWDVTLSVDPATSGNVRATVTGALATAITWRAYVRALVTPWA